MGVGTRELALEVLLKTAEEGVPGHVALGAVLSKYQFLPKQDRAFLTRLVEGTMEYVILIDFVAGQYSRVPVSKMKPLIREIIRMSIYQLLFMDSVPESAVVNEAVKLTQKRGFYHLKPFVNGLLRTVAREKDHINYPKEEEGVEAYLSVKYSCPEFLIRRWLPLYGREKTEAIVASFLGKRPVMVRVRPGYSVEEVKKSLLAQGAEVEQGPYLPYCLVISGFDHVYALDVFREGKVWVMDVGSMLVGEVCAPKKGDVCLDLCAAPGGKSLLLGDMMGDFGSVEARDVSEAKVALIDEAIARAGSINVTTKVADALVFDLDAELSADLVLADVPCSGFGVLGRKPDMKLSSLEERVAGLVPIQRAILENAALYVKSRGVLVYSTCTISQEENEDNVRWFTENHPFALESLDPFLPEELHRESTREGYLQLLPGVDQSDGFFMARFRRKA